MDEPVADPAAITTYLICAAARERLTVILSGMGGDEVFAGYPRHLAARIGRVADIVPAALRAALRRSARGPRSRSGRPGRLRGPRRNLMKLAARASTPTPLERYLTYCSYYRATSCDELLEPGAPRRARATTTRSAATASTSTRVADEHWLNQLLYVDLKTFLPCLNLTYTDKMSMAASTEVRVPLLDDELVDARRADPARAEAAPAHAQVHLQAQHGGRAAARR